MTGDTSNDGRDSGTGRFAKGQSGNRRGRPRKSKSVGEAIKSAFAEKVTVTEQGKRRRITKLDATAKQIVNKGASGDRHLAKLALELASKTEAKTAQTSSSDQLSETDAQIAQRTIARLRAIFMEEINGPTSDQSEAG